MHALPFALLLLAQQGAQPTSAATAPASSVSRIVITPATRTVRAGDTVQFSAQAFDASGAALQDVKIRFGGGRSGAIDTTGKVVASAIGKMPIVAVATVPGAKPFVERREIEIVPAPAARVEIRIAPAKLVVGQQARVEAVGYSRANDRVYDPIRWTSSAPRIVRAENGIVTAVASIEDPLHPKVISEFTEGVTAGVHSAFVFTQPKFGTHVYLTNDGTGALHVIDITDPKNPKEVAQWRTTNRPDAGRYVHDIDVQDGLLYASYWDDGLVILDIGNGIKGGSPSSPQLVTQFKYNLDSLYRQVEAESGPGFTRGTHTAWRHKNYVFIADEVYRASQVKGAKDESADRMYGTLQVIDVSDIEKPKSVAWYTPENGGVHNVWVAGDTLYMGAYDGGFRVFDISGELKGDLRAQGREIAFVSTADMQGKIQNQAMTWGVVVNPADGLAYVNDFYNGLWIVRVEPKAPPVP
jgi:hypothetical protein